jgi:CBS domain-containing protein
MRVCHDMSLAVKEVMTKNVITIESSTPAKKAAELMDKHDIGCLIVVNEGKPIGIVTERDMLKRVLLQFKDPRITRVSDIMSTPLMVSTPDTELREAVRLMNERRIKKLAVVEGEVLIGLLSITDVVRSLAFLEHTITSLCSRCRWNQNPSQQTPK